MTDPVDIAELVGRLFEAIQHGDEDHRAWLKEAIEAHFAGRDVPAPRGGGRKDALIEQQAARLEALAAEREGMRACLETVRDYVSDVADGPIARKLNEQSKQDRKDAE